MHPAIRGFLGEAGAAFAMRLLLPRRHYEVFDNLIVRAPDGSTTQIDHVVLSPFGVFVVEDKTMSGRIYGSERDTTWTQTFPTGKKFQFQNPLRQNYRHIVCLSEVLGLPKDAFISVVHFAGQAKIMTEVPSNVIVGGLPGYIRRHRYLRLGPEDLAGARGAIMAMRADPTLTASAHLRSLAERHGPRDAVTGAEGLSAPPPGAGKGWAGAAAGLAAAVATGQVSGVGAVLAPCRSAGIAAVLGVASLVPVLGLIMAPLALVLGRRALGRAEAAGPAGLPAALIARKARRFAWAGLILHGCGLVTIFGVAVAVQGVQHMVAGLIGGAQTRQAARVQSPPRQAEATPRPAQPEPQPAVRPPIVLIHETPASVPAPLPPAPAGAWSNLPASPPQPNPDVNAIRSRARPYITPTPKIPNAVGVVLVVAEVSPTGGVTGVSLAKSSGSQALDAAALDTVRQWHFRPATTYTGKSVASKETVVVRVGR